MKHSDNKFFWGVAIFGSLSFFSVDVAGQGQPGTLGSEQIDVVKDYSPTLADAQKITFQAEQPQLERVQPKIDYSVPVKLLEVSYEPPEIRPIGIAKEKPEPFRASYVKAGFGTQYTPLLEAMWNEGEFEKYNYGVFLRHLSSRGKLDHQDFSENNIAVFGNYYMKKVKLSSELDYERDGVHYYGYDHEDTSFSKKDVKQHFSFYEWKTELKNGAINKADIDYYSKLDLSYLSAFSDNKEFDINWHTALKKRFKNTHFIDFTFTEDYSSYTPPDLFNESQPSLKRNILSINGKYTFNDDSWDLSAGVTATWDDKIFHLFPDFGAGRKLIGDKLVFYNGWTMWLQKNSFKSLTDENPFIDPVLARLINSRVEDRFTGFKGTVLRNFSYDLRFTQKIVRNMPFFINNPLDLRKFLVVYDNRTEIINLHGEISYKIGDNLNLLLMADYYRYDMDNRDSLTARPWHKPSFRSSIGGRYKIAEKIFLAADIYGISGVYAKVPVVNAGDTGEEKLNGIIDVNVGANYKYSELLTFFINLNNLASVKHERWYRYPTYGFNGLAGVKLTF